MTRDSNRVTKPTSKGKFESSPPMRQTNPIALFFQFPQHQTNFRREILAGFTTFFTMSYILVVNPDILSNAIFLQQSQDLFGELVIATAISATIASLIMGLYAKYPFVLAPGIGLNAYFAFSDTTWKVRTKARNKQVFDKTWKVKGKV